MSAARRTVKPVVAKSGQHSESVQKQRGLDRRVERTRNALRAALHSLVARKPYDEIALAEVLTEANVGRSTFYLHFRDKDDLLLSTVADVMTVAGGPPKGTGQWFDSILWFSLPMFEYHAHRKAMAGHRMGDQAKRVLHRHLERAICDLIELQVERQFRDAELVRRFVASSFILVLNWWLEAKGSMTPDQIDDVFRKLVVPGLTAFR